MRKKKEPTAAYIAKRIQRNLKSHLKKKLQNVYKTGDWQIALKYRDALNRKHKPSVSKRLHIERLCKNSRVKIHAPKQIDFYNVHNFEVVTAFLTRIRKCVRGGGRVFINFSQTEYISAAAMLSFLAEIEVLITESPLGQRVIAFSHPENDKVESILKQVGFYGLLKKAERQTKEYDDVTFWKYASGVCSEPVLAKEIFAEVKQEIQMAGSKKLYRGFVEAMSNSVEHAYAVVKQLGDGGATSKWWAFAGIKDGNLIFVICDKGVGIPNTLPATQKGNIDTIFKLLGIIGRKDSSFIKAATNLSKTSTLLPNRGKGFKDIKSVIDTHDSARLSIFSNRGRYMYKGVDRGKIKEIAYDYKHSVNGTIIEWLLPLSREGVVNE